MNPEIADVHYTTEDLAEDSEDDDFDNDNGCKSLPKSQYNIVGPCKRIINGLPCVGVMKGPKFRLKHSPSYQCSSRKCGTNRIIKDADLVGYVDKPAQNMVEKVDNDNEKGAPAPPKRRRSKCGVNVPCSRMFGVVPCVGIMKGPIFNTGRAPFYKCNNLKCGTRSTVTNAGTWSEMGEVPSCMGKCWRFPSCQGLAFLFVDNISGTTAIETVRCSQCDSQKPLTQFGKDSEGNCVLRSEFATCNINNKESDNTGNSVPNKSRSEACDSIWNRLGLDTLNINRAGETINPTSTPPTSKPRSSPVPENSGSQVHENSGSQVPENSGSQVPENSGSQVPDPCGTESPEHVDSYSPELGSCETPESIANNPSVTPNIPHFLPQFGESMQEYLVRAMQLARKNHMNINSEKKSPKVKGKVYCKEDLQCKPLFYVDNHTPIDRDRTAQKHYSMRQVVASNVWDCLKKKMRRPTNIGVRSPPSPVRRKSTELIPEDDILTPDVSHSPADIEHGCSDVKRERRSMERGERSMTPRRRSSRPPKPAAWVLASRSGGTQQNGTSNTPEISNRECSTPTSDIPSHANTDVWTGDVGWKVNTLDKYRIARQNRKPPPYLCNKLIREKKMSDDTSPTNGTIPSGTCSIDSSFAEAVKEETIGEHSNELTTAVVKRGIQMVEPVQISRVTAGWLVMQTVASPAKRARVAEDCMQIVEPGKKVPMQTIYRAIQEVKPGREIYDIDQSMHLNHSGNQTNQIIEETVSESVSVGETSPSAETSTLTCGDSTSPYKSVRLRYPSVQDALRALPMAFSRTYACYWKQINGRHQIPNTFNTVFHKAIHDASERNALLSKRLPKRCSCCAVGKDNNKISKSVIRESVPVSKGCAGCGQYIDLPPGEVCTECKAPFQQYIEQPWTVRSISCGENHKIGQDCHSCWFWRSVNAMKKIVNKDKIADKSSLPTETNGHGISCDDSVGRARVRYVCRSLNQVTASNVLSLSALPLLRKQRLYAQARASYEDETPVYLQVNTKSTTKCSKGSQKKSKCAKRVRTPQKVCPDPVYTPLFSTSSHNESLVNPGDVCAVKCRRKSLIPLKVLWSPEKETEKIVEDCVSLEEQVPQVMLERLVVLPTLCESSVQVALSTLQSNTPVNSAAEFVSNNAIQLSQCPTVSFITPPVNIFTKMGPAFTRVRNDVIGEEDVDVDVINDLDMQIKEL